MAMFLKTPAGGVADYGARSLLVTVLILLLAACAGPSLKKEIVRFEPTYAKPPAQTRHAVGTGQRHHARARSRKLPVFACWTTATMAWRRAWR